MFIDKSKFASAVTALIVTVVATYMATPVSVEAAETTAAISAPQQAAVSNAPEMTGRAILERCAAAYAALSTYVGKTSVLSDNVTDGIRSQYDGTANIRFTRPDFLHIDGLTASGRTYQITFDGKKTMLEHPWKDGDGKKEVKEVASPELAVAAMTGVAGAAPTFIPAALMNFNWGFPFVEKATKDAVLQGQEDISGDMCYKVVITAPHDKRTFWVNTKSALLRRYKHEQDEIDVAKIFKDLPRPLPEGFAVPKSMSSVAVHDFIIESVS